MNNMDIDHSRGHTSHSSPAAGTGTELDSPPRSGMMFGDIARFLVVYVLFSILLGVTGIQNKFNNWAIHKGMEFREWRRKRQERRDRERLGLEAGKLETDERDIDRIKSESLGDNTMCTGQSSNEARDTEAIAKDPTSMLATLGLESWEQKIDHKAQQKTPNV
ncbi:hypothetical protein TWF718_002941 [Orbilia javanica]|uniref:Uncharacterized protein n=1 Tax=Orbilia javanica TaxID=47235 RepID=A0AAN8RJ88_9PEZI